MATFPTNIPMDLETTETRMRGINTVEMEDLTPHTQSFRPTGFEWVDYTVRNDALTQAERDQVETFLDTNETLEFDLGLDIREKVTHLASPSTCIGIVPAQLHLAAESAARMPRAA